MVQLNPLQVADFPWAVTAVMTVRLRHEGAPDRRVTPRPAPTIRVMRVTAARRSPTTRPTAEGGPMVARAERRPAGARWEACGRCAGSGGATAGVMTVVARCTDCCAGFLDAGQIGPHHKFAVGLDLGPAAPASGSPVSCGFTCALGARAMGFAGFPVGSRKGPAWGIVDLWRVLPERFRAHDRSAGPHGVSILVAAPCGRRYLSLNAGRRAGRARSGPLGVKVSGMRWCTSTAYAVCGTVGVVS